MLTEGTGLNTQFPEARDIMRPGTVCQNVPEDPVTCGSKSWGTRTQRELQVRVSGSHGWDRVVSTSSKPINPPRGVPWISGGLGRTWNSLDAL